MCGIAGLMTFHGACISSSLLNDMVHSMSHRGPDDTGVYIAPDQSVGLGSRRLSIQDLSPAGHMPMSNTDQRVWIAFNGEIYNFRALRSDLRRHGFQFTSRSDTEVLVHAYEARGLSFLDDLEGMFAIALWDAANSMLLLARDRLGEKPLYVSRYGGMLRFASEAKSILQDPLMPRVLDLEALNQYLTFGFVQPPRTMFQHVSKLAPGERLVVFADGRKELSRYWTPLADTDEVRRVRSLSVAHHVSAVRAQLERSVEDCLVADVPVGAFLSGGVDSSAVVSIMSRRIGRRVESVNVSYSQPDCDESRFARQVAESSGANLHQVSVSSGDAEEVLSDCLYHLDEPIADPACVNTFIASRYLRSLGVPVALVGEGADELFLGYPAYLRHEKLRRFWALSQWAPPAMRELVQALTSPLLGVFGLAAHRDLLRRMARGETLFLSSDHSFADCDKLTLVGGQLLDLARSRPSASVTQAMLGLENGLLAGDFLAQVSLAESRMRMSGQLLMRVDKLSMAHSIEIRAPFLNWRLANYALALPGHVRALGGAPKGLLKAALTGLVPQEILERPKMGFSTPVRHWFHTWAADRLLTSISRCDLFMSGLLSAGEVRRLLAEHKTGRNHHVELWNILCLVEWWERYQLNAAGTWDAQLA
jgi:asparagine synthase (glutamine-hydrolysing)